MFVKKTVPKRILAVCLSVFIVLVLLPSSSATEQVSYIGFTSDVHGETAISAIGSGLDDGLPIGRFVFGVTLIIRKAFNVTAANCAALVSGAFPGAKFLQRNHDVPDAADFKMWAQFPLRATEDGRI